MNQQRNGSSVDKSKFDTFGGVFTPCTLTILGVIMFLRFGQVVGQAGVIHTLLIVLLANVLTLLTAFSLSAIATNTQVKGGGAYFLISRSLGVEFGGAIGVLFFLAQAISVAMYVIGFSEAFVAVFPLRGLTIPFVATATNLAVFLCVMVGAGWTIKTQYAILSVLVAALGSFYWGALTSADGTLLQENLRPGYTDGENFFSMFALFFPAATGIMAGANMSGDLRDPARSIPRGTLGAIAATAAVYLTMAIVLGAVASRDRLITDNQIVNHVAFWPAMVTAGVFAATLSSALGSMMGAPRILQALARDDVFGGLKAFALGSGTGGEPRRATILTFLISEACVVTGDLNAIAPVITMAFMITYGTLNLATFYESITRNPSYRPRFRFSHWSTALLGAIGCLAVMLLIAPLWAVVAIVFMYGLHRYISRKEMEARWGDLQSGVVFERARKNLLRLEEEYYHPKNWRPIILAMIGVAHSRVHLAVYGNWLTAGHGILTLGQVIPGDVEDVLDRLQNQELLLRKFIREHDLKAFTAVVAAPRLADGIQWLVQCQGLGGLRPNTVLLGWPGNPERIESFGRTLRLVAQLRRSVVIVRSPEGDDDPWRVRAGTIDVWWRGERNGALMLLFAHLLVQNNRWRGRTIRLLRVIPSKEGRVDVMHHLSDLIETARIKVTPEVVVADGADVGAIIRKTSAQAAVVFLGFFVPEEGHEVTLYQTMDRFAGDLDTVVFVNSAGGMTLES